MTPISAMTRLISEGGHRDDDGSIRFSYAHPIFWAPFVIVGDGGQAKAGVLNEPAS